MRSVAEAPWERCNHKRTMASMISNSEELAAGCSQNRKKSWYQQDVEVLPSEKMAVGL